MENGSSISNRIGGKTVMLRLPTDLVEKLKEEARRKGLSLSSFLRMKLFEAGVVDE